MQKLLLCGFLFYSLSLQAQEIRILAENNPASLRGLSVVGNQIVWVSGSQGTVGRTIDEGKTWRWFHVNNYEKSDFRDIEAFSEEEALIMSTTDPAVVLRTTDGGVTWKTVFEDSSKDVFLDAMCFSGNEGILIGDPIGLKIFSARTLNRGQIWNKDISVFSPANNGEAFFAASGSNIGAVSNNQWALVSGGRYSRLFWKNQSFPLLITQGKETTGANSIAINPENQNQAFIVGGDFSHASTRYRNGVLIQFHPFSQISPIVGPLGYRSCVEYLNGNALVCCGTSGVDVSLDGGMNWKLISTLGFNTCRKSKSGKTVFLAGPDGKVAVIKF